MTKPRESVLRCEGSLGIMFFPMLCIEQVTVGQGDLRASIGGGQYRQHTVGKFETNQA